MTGSNPFLPILATVQEVIEETPNIKTFRVSLDDPEVREAFDFKPGQVAQLSVFGVGEATFVINSPPSERDYLQFTVMRVGEVTTKLHELRTGDKVGVRGPLGNWFPYEEMKGKDVLLIAGGIGMAPLRTLLLFILENRADYGRVTLLYGCRTPQDMCFKGDIPQWRSQRDVEVILTVDRRAPGWTEMVGLVPEVLKEIAPSPKGTVAVTCGPPVMIKYTLEALKELGFGDEQIVTTLERRMKCGVGLCGRCNIGSRYVCKDGPVFTLAQLKALPAEVF